MEHANVALKEKLSIQQQVMHNELKNKQQLIREHNVEELPNASDSRHTSLKHVETKGSTVTESLDPKYKEPLTNSVETNAHKQKIIPTQVETDASVLTFSQRRALFKQQEPEEERLKERGKKALP